MQSSTLKACRRTLARASNGVGVVCGGRRRKIDVLDERRPRVGRNDRAVGGGERRRLADERIAAIADYARLIVGSEQVDVEVDGAAELLGLVECDERSRITSSEDLKKCRGRRRGEKAAADGAPLAGRSRGK